MAVVVASAITQTGSTISGDVRKIVLVQTNRGLDINHRPREGVLRAATSVR
jgi:hypothetical protein